MSRANSADEAADSPSARYCSINSSCFFKYSPRRSIRILFSKLLRLACGLQNICHNIITRLIRTQIVMTIQAQLLTNPIVAERNEQTALPRWRTATNWSSRASYFGAMLLTALYMSKSHRILNKKAPIMVFIRHLVGGGLFEAQGRPTLS
jgi:hypothetical protein